MMPDYSDALRLKVTLEQMASRARDMGYVLTLEQKSVPPLAMGNTVDVITVTKMMSRDEYPNS